MGGELSSIAVAYRFTGEDPVVVTAELRRVCDSVRRSGIGVFCAREFEAKFLAQGMTNEEIYPWCLQEFRKHHAVLVFLRSDRPSRGIWLELEDARRTGRPVFLATPRNVQLYREYACEIIEYEELDELCSMLQTHRFVAPVH